MDGFISILMNHFPFLLNISSTWFMVGLIWLIQVVHYLFDKKRPYYTIVFNILFHSVQNYKYLKIPLLRISGLHRPFQEGSVSQETVPGIQDQPS